MAKPKVTKIVLFWLGTVPERVDAQQIANLLPQDMHPELDFETTNSHDEHISPNNVTKLMKFTKSFTEAMGNVGTSEAREVEAMSIAVMMIILRNLASNHAFYYSRFPNRLVCKYIETTAGHCYYALILDSDIKPSEYEFTTGPSASSLSSILGKAVKAGIRKKRRSRGLRALAAVLSFGIAIAVILHMRADKIADNRRDSVFDAKIQTAVHEVGPEIAYLVGGLDPSREKRPPKELDQVMRELIRVNKLRFALLFLSDPSSTDFLWLLVSDRRCLPRSGGPRLFKSSCHFEKITKLTGSLFIRTIHQTFLGDRSSINAFNQEQRDARLFVIDGKQGEPLAILMLSWKAS